jgi:protein-disulfide isomerase
VDRAQLRQQLADIRRRREDGRHLDSELARDEAALVEQLGHELAGDTAEERRAVADLAAAALQDRYGPLRSLDDLPAVLHAWRSRIPGTRALWRQVDDARDHVRGDAAAPVVVVEYGDYQCVECAEATTLAARLTHWLDEGRLCFVWRHFPVVDAHPLALRAAQAAEAAAAQERFWELHRELLSFRVVTDDSYQEHVRLATPRDAKALDRVASRAGLDLKQFNAAIDDPRAAERILGDVRSGLASGVNGTPTFYLNGERIDMTGPDDLYARIGDLISSTDQAA